MFLHLLYYFKANMCFSFCHRYLKEEESVGKALIHVIFQNFAMGCLNFVHLIWKLPTYKRAIINLPIALEEYAEIEQGSASVCLENVTIYFFFWALFLSYCFSKVSKTPKEKGLFVKSKFEHKIEIIVTLNNVKR